MKSTKFTLTLVCFLVCLGYTKAQSDYNPWAKYGYTPPKALTLSNGKYQEFFDDDTIVQIGSIMFNTITNQIVGFVKQDTTYSEATLEPHVISRWLSPDPMAKERESLTPYNFVSNNPIMRIDPDGALDNPIFDREGELLGTDDRGMQGDAIIMKKSDFSQGMKHEDALSKQLGFKGLNSSSAESKFANTYQNLPSRPDYDGKLELGEANKWFKNGGGKPLYVDAAKIDLSPVKKSDFGGVGNFLSKNFALTTNTATGWVYGSIQLTLTGNRVDNTGIVKLGGKNGYLDTYNFDYKKVVGVKTLVRNILNFAGELNAGEGKQYDIYNYGTGTVR